MDDIYGNRKILKRLSSLQAYETLGVFIFPDGQLKEQINKMHSLAVRWADTMRTGSLKRDEVWLALRTMIWKTLSYPLPALNLYVLKGDLI